MEQFTITGEVAANDGIRVFLLSVAQNREYIDHTIIPDIQVARINRYHIPHDREKRLLARCFLYTYLKKYHSINDFSTAEGIYKKPFLQNAPDFQFSFSYSGDYVLIGISTAGPIGVDIECVTASVNIEEIAPNIMCAEELDYFHELSTVPIEKLAYFFSVFSTKEAIIKAFGTGLYYDVTRMNTLAGKNISYNSLPYTYERLFEKENTFFAYLCKSSGFI